MFFECIGPGGGQKVNFKKIAKVGARERDGERLEPPVVEWAQEALVEFRTVLQGNWGSEDFTPPTNFSISLVAS